ncbi:hypothetical protein G6F50_017160 [Rhizopus delemar]|uniref:Uncharacterized protein n=1 Tax=Rhizopus delemar TaxID=936053 RepID=A0A9P6XQS4_9FUNG|nr:hypothetical protein G6F50_017160 [Rhizopus delemar]
MARLPDAQRRADRKADARRDQAQQGIGVVEFKGALDHHVVRFDQAIDLGADERTRAVADELHALAQFLERGDLVHVHRARHDQHIGFAEQADLLDVAGLPAACPARA